MTASHCVTSIGADFAARNLLRNLSAQPAEKTLEKQTWCQIWLADCVTCLTFSPISHSKAQVTVSAYIIQPMSNYSLGRNGGYAAQLSKTLWPLWFEVTQVTQLPIAGHPRRDPTHIGETNMTTQRRGWVEIYPSEIEGHWEVYDWSEHGDSGQLVGTYDSRAAAVIAGQAVSAKSNRKLLASVAL